MSTWFMPSNEHYLVGIIIPLEMCDRTIDTTKLMYSFRIYWTYYDPYVKINEDQPRTNQLDALSLYSEKHND